MPSPLRVLVVRGHQANPWELHPWELLDPDLFAVTYLDTGSGWFDTARVDLDRRRVRALRDVLPRGRAGDLLTRVPGDRYLAGDDAFAGADIVHAQELGYWYSAQAAHAKRALGFKLVLTAWETIPLRATFRNVRTRPYRERVLREADFFLPATRRAAECLRVEGVEPARIRVVPPGVDTARFAARRGGAVDGGRGAPHVLSVGRLVWEKGHQDVLRAVAALRRGIVDSAAGVRGVDGVDGVTATIVGDGPERARLHAYARDLGIGDAVQFRGNVPYDEMPGVYASASCLVLASLPTVFWEEQFGMVLAEAMAAGLPIIAAASGAIPEVVGDDGALFAPGDWLALAEHVAAPPPPPVEARFTATKTADALAAAYTELDLGAP